MDELQLRVKHLTSSFTRFEGHQRVGSEYNFKCDVKHWRVISLSTRVAAIVAKMLNLALTQNDEDEFLKSTE